MAVAAAHGVRAHDPRVLKDGANVVAHLRPAPVVARVATVTAAVRGRGAEPWLAREVAPARHLRDAGAPALAPSERPPPGPHRHDGLVMTFCPHVDHNPLRPLRPEALGRTLGRAADGLAGRGSARPLHEDAHPNNVQRTSDGPRWTDLEDACAGPVEWDLACLTIDARRFGARTGLDEAAVARALSAYGGTAGDAALAPFLEARGVQVVVWSALLSARKPGLRSGLDARLAWWRSRED